MERKHYKALNFDLDTSKLKEYYPKANIRQAYRDIKIFLLANGFEHRQWSGYRTTMPVTDTKIVDIVSAMYNKYWWLSKCVNCLDVTDIGKNYDLKILFEKDNSKSIEQLSQNVQLEKCKSLKERIAAAKLKQEAAVLNHQLIKTSKKKKNLSLKDKIQNFLF